ncbi:hypothetical protein AX14_006852 [Amanita brunnescens Koide BX004]|nr:hypothetical protein AX14_006852 [Amanita brunnescens Koide BX004]
MGQRPPMPILHPLVIVSQLQSEDEKGKRKRRRNSPHPGKTSGPSCSQLAIDGRTFFTQTTHLCFIWGRGDT